MTDHNTPENNSESFVRWQQLTLEERGKSINLFIGSLFATIGFIIAKLTDKDFEFHNSCSKNLILLGSGIGLISILIFILLILNRLKDFRITTEIAKLSLY